MGTPTPTNTPCSPVPCTNTPTQTSTNTPTATPTPCGVFGDYQVITGTNTIVAGTTDVGNHCDDCATTVTLPFPYSLYDQSFTSASVTSNGQLDFMTADSSFSNTCLPDGAASYAIFPHWDDLRTDAAGSGIFSTVEGTAPNRIFDLEWRATLFSGGGAVNFEVRLYEGQNRFDIIYATVTNAGITATVGVQKDTGFSTEYECNTGGLTSGLQLVFTQPPCGSPTFTATPTRTNTPCVSCPTSTRTATVTNTPCVVSTPGWAPGSQLPEGHGSRGRRLVSHERQVLRYGWPHIRCSRF